MRHAYANVVVRFDHGAARRSCRTSGAARRAAAMERSSTGCGRTVDDAAAVPDATIVNTGSAEYHARVSWSASSRASVGSEGSAVSGDRENG